MQYLGLMDCPYYQGKVGEIDHKCCGGRISKWARIKCKKRGVVTAQNICTQRCEHGPKHRTFNMGPKEESKNDLDDKVEATRLISEQKQVDIISKPKPVEIVDKEESKSSESSTAANERPKTIWQVWTEEILAEKAKTNK